MQRRNDRNIENYLEPAFFFGMTNSNLTVKETFISARSFFEEYIYRILQNAFRFHEI